jgi:hypothetical protein
MQQVCSMRALILLCVFSLSRGYITMLAGGFGKAKVYIPHQQLETTRPNESREITGRFSKFLAKRCESFERLRKADFPVACDLYARASSTSTFWFIGKLCHDTGLKFEEALTIEYPVVVEYAKALRPKELTSPLVIKQASDLQIWYAKGNSEMDVAQNKVSLKRFTPLALEEYSHLLESAAVEDFIGLEPEIYQGGEVGFRVQRSESGEPLAPAFEINTQPPPV